MGCAKGVERWGRISLARIAFPSRKREFGGKGVRKHQKNFTKALVSCIVLCITVGRSVGRSLGHFFDHFLHSARPLLSVSSPSLSDEVRDVMLTRCGAVPTSDADDSDNFLSFASQTRLVVTSQHG